MKRAVIFDFDGVVADTWALHVRAWQTVLHREASDMPSIISARSVGMTPLETARQLIEECSLEASAEELAQEKEELFTRLAVKELQPIAGAVEAIERLLGDFKVALTSMRSREMAEAMMNRSKLNTDALVLVASAGLSVETETESLYLEALKTLELSAKDCVAVDDDRTGILAAKRSGISAIAFDSNPEHDIDFSMADAQITSLDELVPELVNQVIAG